MLMLSGTVYVQPSAVLVSTVCSSVSASCMVPSELISRLVSCTPPDGSFANVNLMVSPTASSGGSLPVISAPLAFAPMPSSCSPALSGDVLHHADRLPVTRGSLLHLHLDRRTGIAKYQLYNGSFRIIIAVAPAADGLPDDFGVLHQHQIGVAAQRCRNTA